MVLNANQSQAWCRVVLHARRRRTVRCLPDCMVTGATPQRAASIGGGVGLQQIENPIPMQITDRLPGVEMPADPVVSQPLELHRAFLHEVLAQRHPLAQGPCGFAVGSKRTQVLMTGAQELRHGSGIAFVILQAGRRETVARVRRTWDSDRTL